MLIIDDDPAVIDATQLLLELEGYRVLVASTLEAALNNVHTAAVPPAMIVPTITSVAASLALTQYAPYGGQHAAKYPPCW